MCEPHSVRTTAMMDCLGCRHMQRAYSPPTSLAVSTCNSQEKGLASGIGKRCTV